MTRLSAALGLLALLFSHHASAQSVFNDVAYGDKARNQLDLYLPEGVENPPLVVFIHGGRWFRNDKTQIERYGRIDSLMNAGFALASINYTFSSEAIWPAQAEDVDKAMTFLRSNADKYGFDADHMAVWGQSSGAHMALWAGLRSAKDPKTMVDAVVSWYAPSDLYNIASDRKLDAVPDGRERPGKTPESLLIGKEVMENKDAADAASPVPYISALSKGQPLPSFLIMHGTMDPVVSPLQSERLYSVLKEQGGAKKIDLVYVKDGNHGGDLFIPHVTEVVAFLKDAFAQSDK